MSWSRYIAIVSLTVLAALGWARPAACAEGARVIVYPSPESQHDARRAYPLAVLRLALARSDGRFLLRPSGARMQQLRALRALAAGKGIDVIWSVTSVQREAELRPIRIPIDRGLLGWRVLLIRRGDAARFAAIDSLPALAEQLAAQGHDWPDLAVLRGAGLRAAASPTYDGLFAMLTRGHIDYFPRSVVEVAAELDVRRGQPIELERTLLLRYPSALYFFVARDDHALAAAIETGLERSLRDGSLMQLFDATYGPVLAALDLPKRRMLDLPRDDLPPATPLSRPELWYGGAPRR